MEFVPGLILIAISLFIYFIPTLIAGNRSHREIWGIFILNLFFGWTLIGWVAALIWSASGKAGHAEST